MASLNLSTNGPSISKSYQSVLNSPPPSGPAASSPTYGQWAIYSVSAPLANAFQQDAGGKESILKVQSTGEGELLDLIDEFSDGKIQFAFAKIRDPNTTLSKSVLIGWCGEGVPERTKGYFTSHLAAVSKTLQGYHVQITARSDRDLTPESIVHKVSEASGSKYGGGPSTSTASTGPPPPVSSKPAFTPTRSSAGAGSFNPLASSRTRADPSRNAAVDSDGWGEDAPPVTRTQLEKVAPAYQPTKIELHAPASNRSTPSAFNTPIQERAGDKESDVVKGGYQPVGKVDIAAIRRQAQLAGTGDERPEPVKGAYEPVGKVDIAAIRARAQPSSASTSREPPAPEVPQTKASFSSDGPTSFNTSERLTSLPKPKVSNRFGAGAASFAGTKAPTPGAFGLESKPASQAPPVGVGRTFADKGGKTPAQLWAEKKAKERGEPTLSSTPSGPPPSSVDEASKGGEWKSGYQGKSWAPVETTRTGQSSTDLEPHHGDRGERSDDENPPPSQAPSFFGGVGALRDRFKSTSLVHADEPDSSAPPPLDTSNKPNAGRGIPMPGLSSRPPDSPEQAAPSMPSPPPQPPRSPTPPTPPGMVSGSPIRIARPVGRGAGQEDDDVQNAREEQTSPPPAMPVRSLTKAVPHEDNLPDEPRGHDPARAAGVAAAAATFGAGAAVAAGAAAAAESQAEDSGKVAVVQYDYEKAEDNEIDLREGERVTDIEMVDENWWMGRNVRGDTGLFPSNYVELVDEQSAPESPPAQSPREDTPLLAARPAEPSSAATKGAIATALYDYEAAEDNELSFPENAKITGIEFPDEDWWSGEYGGRQGLFPANYVQLDE